MAEPCMRSAINNLRDQTRGTRGEQPNYEPPWRLHGKMWQ